MFGIDSSELFIIGLVALLVIGPAKLPMAMKSVGQWVAKGRAMTRHVRTGFDAMVREAELDEMQKSWAKHNEAIMKATSPTAYLTAPDEVAAEAAVPESPPESPPESAELMAAATPAPEAAPKPAPKLARKRAPRKKKPAGDDV